MNITLGLISRILLTVFVLFLSPNLMASEHNTVELAARLNIVGSDGTPTNDMLGYGLVGHYKLSNEWYAGFTLDISPNFDFERTAAVVGITQDPSVEVIDAIGTSTALSGFIERRYQSESGNFQWFWNVGAGMAKLDFDNATGPVQGGGNFDISTIADTEILITSSIGMQQQINDNWSARYSFSYDKHLADWTVTDSISSATAKVGDYAIYGLRFGLNRRF